HPGADSRRGRRRASPALVFNAGHAADLGADPDQRHAAHALRDQIERWRASSSKLDAVARARARARARAAREPVAPWIARSPEREAPRPLGVQMADRQPASGHARAQRGARERIATALADPRLEGLRTDAQRSAPAPRLARARR